MFDFDIDWDQVVVYASAVAAFVSFMLFALPLISRTEKKERFKAVIEKQRKAAYETAKTESETGKKKQGKDTSVEASSSMAMFFKLQTLAGETAKAAKNMMLMAGIRTPSAPLIYLVSRMIAPLVFAFLGMTFMALSHKNLPNAAEASIVLASAGIGFFMPRLLIKNMIDKRQIEISLMFPDALDMILICVQGGLGVEAAINRITETIAESSTTLAEELGILSAELSMMNDRRAAFQGFANRVGSGSARSFATAMLQAEQYGTSVSKALRVLSEDLRDQRMAEAERKAASLPPKLTVPMILFFLPALFTTILGPAFLKSQ